MSPDPNSYVLLVRTDDVFNQKATIDLREVGYSTIVIQDLNKAWLQFNAHEPAMVVLDRALAGEAGVKFCRQIRSAGYRTPVLILMDRETVEDRVVCLEAGADDYLIKPYHTERFLQLVYLYLKPTVNPTEQLRFADLILDLTIRKVLRNGKEIDLTMKEFELMRYLMSHPQQVLTREQILENVWGYDFQGESNVIEVYIRYLRLKIEDEGQKRLIQTVRGVGYVLRET